MMMLNFKKQDRRSDLPLPRKRFVVGVLILILAGVTVMFITTANLCQSDKQVGTRSDHLLTAPDGSPDTPKKRLPNALIAGCGKCGTRALLWFLSLHPEIKSVEPEIHFFDRDENYEKGLDWYRSFFPPRLATQIGIEKSPSYFVTEGVPERIHEMDSSVKIIVIVCEPVNKIVSRFAQLLEKGTGSVELEKFVLDSAGKNVDYDAPTVKDGLYHHHLVNWIKWFPLKQMLFLDGERLKTDPLPQIKLVETFLNIPHKIDDRMVVFNETKGFYCIVRDTVRCLGESKGRPHPPTDPTLQQKLTNFYRPYNQLFFKTIGQDFDWD